MLTVIAALIVAGAVLRAATLVVNALQYSRAEAMRTRMAALLAVFASGMSEAERDVRALLVWEPLARTARALSPDEFVLLDQAAGHPFPFSKERLQAAHARWTADWLSWERAHDMEYKLKAAAAEHDLTVSSDAALFRAKLDAVEREKLDLYQQQYEEYIRIAKALQALAARP